MPGGVCPGGCMPRGMSAWGCLPGGCLHKGVSAQGCVCLWSGRCLPLVLRGVCKEEAVGLLMVLVSHYPLFDLPHFLNSKPRLSTRRH